MPLDQGGVPLLVSGHDCRHHADTERERERERERESKKEGGREKERRRETKGGYEDSFSTLKNKATINRMREH